MRCKRITKAIKVDDRGNSVIEATLVLPLFLFLMLFFYLTGLTKIVDEIIYISTEKTAQYCAQLSYFDENAALMPQLYFRNYVDNKELVQKMIKGGMSGVVMNGKTIDDILVVEAKYTLEIDVPFIPKVKKRRSIAIKIRCYIGEEKNSDDDKSEKLSYVYVTDNESVYHGSRSCTHLMLSIQASDYMSAVSNGFEECEYCCKDAALNKDIVYITDNGKKYHLSTSCRGLKRTVRRVKKSEVQSLDGCERCVGK